MFSMTHNLTSKNTMIRVSFKEKTVEFVISPTIVSKDRSGDVNALQFTLLNAYLDYKGDGFKELLINTLEKSYEMVMDTLDLHGIEQLPYKAIDNIIDLMDLEDIYKYIKHGYRLTPPANLKDTFDEQIELDAKGSRDQTYTKDDYLYLSALVLIIKATIGPICLYSYIKQNEINPSIKEYFLFHFYKHNDKFINYPPMVKICRFTEQIIKQSYTGDAGDKIRVLEKSIPIEELPVFMTGILLIQKLATATLVDDTADKNIVNRSYNYINGKMKSPNNTSKTIRDKEPMADLDSASNDKESIAESLRIQGELAPGMAIEMDWAVNSVDKILKQLPPKMREVIAPEVLQDAVIFSKEFQTARIAKCNIDLLSYIFKSILDPRSLDYIKLDSVINLISVGFAYLWGLGFKSIAVLLMSKVSLDIEETIAYNATINKPRISKELKERLDAMFPYKKVINKDTLENVCEKAISDLSKEYESHDWRTLVDDRYRLEGPIVPVDIRIQLLEFILANERMTYDRV